MTNPFPVPEMDDSVEIRDFTIKRKRIKFKIDDDVFEATAILSIPLMHELVKVGKNVQQLVGEQKFDSVTSVFQKILLPASAKRFGERLDAIYDDALDIKEQVIPVLYYLMEQYGVRPTQPSSDSSTGSPSETDGTTSTAGLSPQDSIPQS